MKKIVIKAGQITAEAELNESATAMVIWQAHPCLWNRLNHKHMEGRVAVESRSIVSRSWYWYYTRLMEHRWDIGVANYTATP
jgi:hypothetical protein